MGAGAWRTRTRERAVSRPTATTNAGQDGIALGESAPNAIRFNLVLPAAKMGFGPFSFDPMEQAIGAPIADILESLMTGPVAQRPSHAGPAVDVYSLALPDGEGLTLPLGRWGELGFRNEASRLVLTVPLPAATWVQRTLASSIERGPDHLLSQDGTARVARFWLQLEPGMNAAFPLGMLGELGIETV